MQSQYNQIKSQHPDKVVLFRLGDFYEAFDSDAEELSRVLGITLTGRGKGENRTPMAGIPYHALDNYLPKLVNAGLKVVMVDQLSEPKPGQLVERGVSKIYTAGTITAQNTLDDAKSNYIACWYPRKDQIAVALAEVSTGKLLVFAGSNSKQMESELARFLPSEIVIPDTAPKPTWQLNAQVTLYPIQYFDPVAAKQKILKLLQVKTLKGFGISDDSNTICALGALLGYIQDCQLADLSHFGRVSVHHFQDHMRLDPSTVRNLELIYPSNGIDSASTLYSVINQTNTNMGKRKLREWLLMPLLNPQELTARWECVDYFYQDLRLNQRVRELLAQIYDIERVVGRIGVGSANARDLLALKDSLGLVLQLPEVLNSPTPPSTIQQFRDLIGQSTQVTLLLNLLTNAIHPNPPATITEGGIINPGWNAEVDELRSLQDGGKQMLATIQSRESESTGITSLKVSYNKVFGYYIEVTNSHLSKVPAHYIRKQTLTGAERYITPELKEWEDKVLNAESRLYALECQEFIQVRSQVAEHSQLLLQIADAIAQLDILACFGHLAREYGYCLPQLSSTPGLRASQARHPVVERLQKDFTPNDVHFDDQNQLIVLTGPNMSGKSTYIRQVALLTLLAQIGCFVPAKQFEFTLVDQIFTRIGASDNLSRGESTFMVEMIETANILNNASSDSLLILDEVGRGTSTYDGVAIAWSVVSYIQSQLHSKTLFATHYHELTRLAEIHPGVVNQQVEVVESGEHILFTHRIIDGATSRSYGVQVAQMAGVPAPVIKMAKAILSDFEGGSTSTESRSKKVQPTPKRPKQIHPEQLGLI